MDFLEQNLEDIVFDAPYLAISQRGIDEYMEDAHTYRQLCLGAYGRSDIIQFKRCSEVIQGRVSPYLNINVIELKKDNIDQNTFFQAVKYCKGILEFIRHRSPKSSIRCKFHIILIGKIIVHSEYDYLQELLGEQNELTIDIYKYQYGFDGISFNRHFGHYLANSGFGVKLRYGYYKKTNPSDTTSNSGKKYTDWIEENMPF